MPTMYEYFDPTNTEHLREYEHLTNTGTWSTSFHEKLVGDDVTFGPVWQHEIAVKIAQYHVRKELTNAGI